MLRVCGNSWKIKEHINKYNLEKKSRWYTLLNSFLLCSLDWQSVYSGIHSNKTYLQIRSHFGCVRWYVWYRFPWILTMMSVEEFKTNESDLNYLMEIYRARISLLLLALYIPKCAKDLGLNKTSLKNHRKMEPTKNGKLLL